MTKEICKVLQEKRENDKVDWSISRENHFLSLERNRFTEMIRVTSQLFEKETVWDLVQQEDKARGLQNIKLPNPEEASRGQTLCFDIDESRTPV